MTHLLVVDDMFDLVLLYSALLVRQGFTVTTAGNGQEGLEVLANMIEPPQAIISNLHMPFIDGYTFLERVRANPHWAHIPFIIVTASEASLERRIALEHGADAFLSKPVTSAAFVSTLAKLGVTP